MGLYRFAGIELGPTPRFFPRWDTAGRGGGAPGGGGGIARGCGRGFGFFLGTKDFLRFRLSGRDFTIYFKQHIVNFY